MDSILQILTKIVRGKFIFFLVVAYAAVRLIGVGVDRLTVQLIPEKQVIQTEDNPANMSYKRAVEMCGQFGISDLDWEDYQKGLIRSVFCQTWQRK